MDFVQLQRIDFNAAFSCSCHGGVTADGITLSFHMAKMSLVSLVQPSSNEGDADMVRGSLFAERNFVKSAAHRYIFIYLHQKPGCLAFHILTARV